jgi:hypothetical protein
MDIQHYPQQRLAELLLAQMGILLMALFLLVVVVLVVQQTQQGLEVLAVVGVLVVAVVVMAKTPQLVVGKAVMARHLSGLGSHVGLG